MSTKPQQETRQDRFEKLIHDGEIGTTAKIKFCGDVIRVRIISRTHDDMFGVHPNNKIVSLAYLGKRKDILPIIAINTWSVNTVDDSELITII